MSGAFTLRQAGRMLLVTSPLGPDALILRRLSVREAIGQPFAISAEVLSQDLDIQPAALLGKAMTFTVAKRGTDERHFHGIVRAVSRLGPFGRGLAGYRIEAVPQLWQLSRTSDCRIFQDRSVRDIGAALLAEHEVAPVAWGDGVPSGKRPYCVQFNETDLAFFQRVLEEAGCGYLFRHAREAHTLVVCGGGGDYPPVPGPPQVVRPHDDTFRSLADWRPVASLQPGRVRAMDYDGLRPGGLLDRQSGTVLSPSAGAAFEMFHWPGGQHVRPEADPSQVAMQGFETGGETVAARGNDPAIFAGGRLRVLHGIEATQPESWLVTVATHEAHDETVLLGEGTADYACILTLVTADPKRQWRPPTPLPRPAMAGVHSAVVTGPAGEEIHCDEHGRVKVHFLWDRAGPRNEHASCWVRVAQGFGGGWGGAWMLPRIGDEVLVAFVDGDVDRPVVIGSVYNAEQKPIYALPANKTQSGLRTRSSKGAGPDNFNELRFEDKKGAEHVRLQAERDLELLVKRDRTEEIRRHRAETVGGKHTETVKLDRSATVTDGNDTLLVKMGDISAKAEMGKVRVEAMQSITLVCGGSKIEMTPSGITLEALTIKISAELGLETQAAMATHKGSATVVIQGGLVKIN